MAISGRNRIVFAVGAILAVQSGIVSFRSDGSECTPQETQKYENRVSTILEVNRAGFLGE